MPAPQFGYPILGKTVLSNFPTPDVSDYYLLEPRRTDNADFEVPAYGTPHPNTSKYPDHKLVLVTFRDDTKHDAVFLYASDRSEESQERYGFALSFSAEDITAPIIVRSYILPREGYEPLAKGTSDPAFAGTTKLVEEKVLETTGQPELDSLYVKVVRVFETLPSPEISSRTKGSLDAIPLEFRSAAEITVLSNFVEAGTEPDDLTGDVIVSSVEDLSTCRAQRKVTSIPLNTAELPGKTVTPQQQVADVLEQLVADDATLTPSALLVDGEVRNLGNGRAVKRQVLVDSVFPETAYVSERGPTNWPAEFRHQLPEQTVSEVTASTSASAPSLSAGDLSARQERITAEKIRTTTVHRDLSALPLSLTGFQMTADGQTATVVKTLDDTAQTISPTATTVLATVEALGDGTTLKTIGTVESVFGAARFSTARFDTLPERFRAAAPVVTTASTAAGTASAPSLGAGELEKVSEQVDAHKVRVTVSGRDVDDIGTLSDLELSPDRALLAVTSSVDETPTATLPSLTNFEIRSLDLGDGLFENVVAVRPEPSLLQGQRFEESLGVVVRFSQQETALNVGLGDDLTEVIPHTETSQIVRIYEPPTDALDEIVEQWPDNVDIRFPDVLLGVSVTHNSQHGDGSHEEASDGISAGTTGSLTLAISGRSQSSASAMPGISLDYKQTWGESMPVQRIWLYMPLSYSRSDLLTRLSSILGVTVHEWPVWQPQGHLITLNGQQASCAAEASAQQHLSFSESEANRTRSLGAGKSYETGVSVASREIPAMLHDEIVISSPSSGAIYATAEATAEIEALGDGSVWGPISAAAPTTTLSATSWVTPDTLPATTPAGLPTSGLYLYKIDTHPIPAWGRSLVSCAVFDFATIA